MSFGRKNELLRYRLLGKRDARSSAKLLAPPTDVSKSTQSICEKSTGNRTNNDVKSRTYTDLRCEEKRVNYTIYQSISLIMLYQILINLSAYGKRKKNPAWWS